MPGSDSRSGRPRTALDALFSGQGADPLRRALWLDALEQRLRPLLPSPLAAHARLANVDGRTLVFLVDAPVWRARLRLAAPELIDVARSLGLDCDAVVARATTHPLWPDPPAPRPPLPMSEAAREALDAALAALDVPDRDPGGKGDG